MISKTFWSCNSKGSICWRARKMTHTSSIFLMNQKTFNLFTLMTTSSVSWYCSSKYSTPKKSKSSITWRKICRSKTKTTRIKSALFKRYNISVRTQLTTVVTNLIFRKNLTENSKSLKSYWEFSLLSTLRKKKKTSPLIC